VERAVPGLGISISVDGGGARVEVTGEVDLATAPELLEAILVVHRAEGQDVTVDLAGVEFMDSRGVATLIQAHRHLAGERCCLRIENPRPTVAKVLDITGVDAYLDGHDQT
jgi:anti-sigma B factor antagonist